jgi:hypothetical protein
MAGMTVDKPAPYTGQLTCPPIDVLQQIWKTECMFP